jgi:hypothetical protein|nr:hypothetical protein [Neorhizobium tomejilense]
MEAAQPTTPTTSFDFGSMSGVVSSSAKPDDLIDDRPPAVEVPAEPAVDASAASAKPEEDEDDLVVGDQLDSVPASASTSGLSSTGSSSAGEVAAEPVATTEDATQEVSDDADVGTRGSDAVMQNPMDPRLAALAAAGRQEVDQRQTERAANGGGRGGAGLGLGAAIGAGLAGSFKLVGNGLKAINGHDPSKPKSMGIMERRANRDPISAEQYYRNAGDKRLREKIYRDAHDGINLDLSAAATAERAFQDHVTRFNDLLQDSPVKDLAEKAQTSVGDFIHAVNSGTIKDAAAKAVVTTLQQNPDFLTAEKGVLDAANTFKQKSQDAIRKLDSVDAAFPGRLDTNLRRQQISSLADGMQNDEASKASSKIKQTMDELQKLAEAIKKIVMDVVNSVTSAFKPK